MNNKKVIILTLFTILGMIIAPTIYKINKNHQEKLLLVVEKELLYQASLCYRNDDCKSVVKLKDLYDKDYIKEKLTNPITKKYYSEDSYIDLNAQELKLIS